MLEDLPHYEIKSRSTSWWKTMYSVQKGGVTGRYEGIECTERKVKRNEMKLLIKPQIKAEKHARIICWRDEWMCS
jgi:hypothetical protein